MALNKEVFKTRSLTAVVFVIVMLLGLFWNRWSFVVLFSIVHFGAWYEFLKLTEKINNDKIDVVIKWLFAICGFTLMLIIGLPHYSVDIGKTFFSYKISFKVLFWLLQLLCLVLFSIQNKQVSIKTKLMCFSGFVYLSLSLGLLLRLRHSPLILHMDSSLSDIGLVISCCIIFSIWINDTMAYVVGSLIGKTPFSKISPKKTWEGTAGGAILCVIVIGILGNFIPAAKEVMIWYNSHTLWFIIAAICAIFGTAGDLLESKIKRMADVKDSGSFMPGHGGFLDRFDSLLVATPFVWLYVQFFV
ncbi:MAG: DUF92 domain-containing protein [Bacteroidota bacterium]